MAGFDAGTVIDAACPYASWIETTGAGMTCLGVAFAIWARYHIGRYWSSTVSLRADHQLVRTGPYAHIRHPIYTGIRWQAPGLRSAGTGCLGHPAKRVHVEGAPGRSPAFDRNRPRL